MTDIEIISNYSHKSTDYKGSAVKLGAGWQIRDIYNKLATIGKVVIAGECPVSALGIFNLILIVL